MGLIPRVGAVVVAGLLALWALWQWVYLPHRCNALITDVDVRTTAAQKTTSDYERLVLARRNLESVPTLRRQCKADVRVYMLAGVNEDMVGRPEDAERSYEEALHADQRPEIHIALARLKLRLGKIDEAVAHYATASRFQPEAYLNIGDEEVMRRVEEQLDARR